MTTRQALVIAVAGTIPGVGGILSTLLQEMTDKIENNEDLKNQCDLLRDKLPKLVKELEDYEDPSALILRVLQNARGLNNVVQARKRTRKRDLFLKREARESLKEFEDQFTTFKRDLENLTTDMIIRIHYDTYITRGKVDDLNNKMDGQSNQLGRQSDLLIKIISLVQELGTKLIDDIPEANLARYQFDLSKALNGFGGGSDEERKQAQRTLIHLSMKLVRYGNESSLTILEELTMDSNAWPVIMKNGSLVEALLEVATKLSSEVEKNIVSRILVKLAAEPGPFFEQLVKPYPPLMWTHTQGALQPKLNERHHAIKDTNLIPEIVIYSSSDENALRVLYEVSKTDYCKAAIAQEGGIATLVAIYQSKKEPFTIGVDACAMLVVDTLTNLSYDEDCRKKLVENDNMWPLLDFIWECSTTHTFFKFNGNIWLEVNDEDITTAPKCFQDAWNNGCADGDYAPTGFDREQVLQTENKAGEALCDLILVDEDCRRCILHFDSKMLDLRFGIKSLHPDTLSDPIYEWLRRADFVKKEQREETIQTFWFVRILWSLLLDQEPQAVVAEWCYETELNFSKVMFFDMARWCKVPAEKIDMWSEPTYTMDPLAETTKEVGNERDLLRALFNFQHAESKLCERICNHLASERFLRFDSCLHEVIRLSTDGDSAQKAKAFGVLWLSVRILGIEPTNINAVTESCEKAISDEGGSVDEVFWATNLLLGILSWYSLNQFRHEFHFNLLALAATGVFRLLQTDERHKYVFLAKYLLLKAEPEDIHPSCIPFIVASFTTIRSSEGALNNIRCSPSITDDKLLLEQRCLTRLACFWPNHKQHIEEEGGVFVLKAMLEQDNLDLSTKQDIKQILKSAAP